MACGVRRDRGFAAMFGSHPGGSHAETILGAVREDGLLVALELRSHELLPFLPRPST